MREAIEEALRGVIDPEMALDIVNLGLVYGIHVEPQRVRIDLTMTSAACPVAELIIDEVQEVLHQTLGDDVAVEVNLVWDPPWTPERMSPRARAVMGWD